LIGFLADGETRPRGAGPSELNGAMADVLAAQDTAEMIEALRSLAAAAERLADALERDVQKRVLCALRRMVRG